MEDYVVSLPKVDAAQHEFRVPKKGIMVQEDMGRWVRSEGATRLLNFIMVLSQSVAQKKISDFPLSSCPSRPVQEAVKMLDQMEGWVAEIPPLQQAQRFGNKAYRSWFERLEQQAPSLMAQVVPAPLHAALPEVTPYLVEAVGNATRIDYGTGHEMSFAAWMAAMHFTSVFTEADFPFLVFHVFRRYLEVMRTLQKAYVMEPAGSHGVWGLDDFQFLPFLWGSAQLIDHPHVKPRSILSNDMVESLMGDYLFMGCIQFIKEMKKGPFAEHSPMLYDVSAVPLWAKVNVGLHKMYAAEVMGKFPVVQHFLFGSLFTLEPCQNVNPFLKNVQLATK